MKVELQSAGFDIVRLLMMQMGLMGRNLLFLMIFRGFLGLLADVFSSLLLLLFVVIHNCVLKCFSHISDLGHQCMWSSVRWLTAVQTLEKIN